MRPVVSVLCNCKSPTVFYRSPSLSVLQLVSVLCNFKSSVVCSCNRSLCYSSSPCCVTLNLQLCFPAIDVVQCCSSSPCLAFKSPTVCSCSNLSVQELVPVLWNLESLFAVYFYRKRLCCDLGPCCVTLNFQSCVPASSSIVFLQPISLLQLETVLFKSPVVCPCSQRL